MSSVLSFSLLKYLEVGITAITMFIIAKKVGPAEMGRAIPVLLYITYSNYLALGLNQAVIKNYSRMIGIKLKVNFITLNLQYLILAIGLNFFIANLILSSDYWLVSAFISCGLLFRGFLASYFRVVFRIKILNKNNLTFAILILVSALLFIDLWIEYLLFWASILWFTIFIYLFDGFKFFKLVFKNIIRKPRIKEIRFNFSEGFKIALTGITTTVLLTSDRLIINQLDVSVNIKGSYQLADYFGMGIYLLITTVFFYYTPQLIEKIRNDKNFRLKYISYLKKSLLMVCPFLLLVYAGAYILAKLFFVEYDNLEYYIVLCTTTKLLIVFLSCFAIYYMGTDREDYYLKSLIPLLVILSIVLITMYIENANIWMVSIAINILIAFEVIRKFFSSKLKY